MRERWVPLEGFETHDISDHGRVRNRKTGNIRTGTIGAQGYLTITLRKPETGRKTYTFTIHSLVARHYLGPRPPGQVVRHKKGKLNNHWTNLQYGTYAENAADMVADGKAGTYNRNKTHCRNGHEYTEENTYRYRNERSCRKCGRDNQIRYTRRKKL